MRCCAGDPRRGGAAFTAPRNSLPSRCGKMRRGLGSRPKSSMGASGEKYVLAQNDNVLIAQSRNVLLTRSGWGGGIRNTSHDPAGPRSVDRSEKGQEGANHTASGRRRDRPNRTAYPAAAGKAEKRGRPGGGPRAPGTSVQPQTGREEPGEGGCDPRAREVSRVRPHAGQRIPWQASPDHSQPRNGE